MPRRLVLAIAALALFAAAVAAGWLAVVRVGPERLRLAAEAGLSEALGAPVRVAWARLEVGGGLRVVAGSLEAFPGPDGPALRVRQISARIAPESVLLGRPRLGAVRVRGPELTLTRRADGRLEPAALLPQAPPQAEPPEAVQWVGALAGVVRGLLERREPGGVLAIADGTLRVRAPDHAAPGASLRVERIQARLVRRRLGGERRLSAEAWLPEAHGGAARVELEATRAREGRFTLRLAASDLDLVRLAPLFEPLGLTVEGAVSGVVELGEQPGAPPHLAFDLALRDLRARHPALASVRGGPAFEVAHAFLQAELAVAPDRIQLVRGAWHADGLDLAGSGGVARPVSAASRIDVDLACRRVSIADLRTATAWLPDPAREVLSAVGSDGGSLRVGRAGELEGVRLKLGASLERLGGWLHGEADAPDDLSLGFSLAGVVLELADTRVGLQGGRVAFTGSTLSLESLLATRDGRPLPRIDLSLGRLDALRDAAPAQRRLAAPVVAVPGVRTGWDWLVEQTRRGERGGERVERVELVVDRLEHPLLVLPVESARATLTLREAGGLDVRLERGTWGGVGLRGQAEWRRDPDRLAIRADVVTPDPPAAADAHWARGRVGVRPLPLGRWHVAAASADFAAQGDRLLLRRVHGTLRERGRLHGRIALDLAPSDAVPFEADLSLAEAQFSELAEVLQLPSDAVTGDFDAAGTLRGRLRPGEPLLASAEGDVYAQGWDGELRGDTPLVAAVQIANQSYSEEESRDPVRFDEVHAELRLAGGRLRIAPFSLDGPSLRLIASGEIDVLHDPHPMEVVIGLFLYRELDRALGRVPVLNSFLLGSDDNLVGAYFALTGPWSDPVAQRIPNRTFAGGPMGFVVRDVPTFMLWDVPSFVVRNAPEFVFRDVPGFVWSGLRSIGSALVYPSGVRRPPEGDEAEQEGS